MKPLPPIKEFIDEAKSNLGYTDLDDGDKIKFICQLKIVLKKLKYNQDDIRRELESH